MQGIYQIKNINNDKVYIGSSSNITLRWNQHLDQLYYKIHDNYKLQDDYNKFGLSSFNFSVLEIVKNKKDLFKKEQVWIDKINVEENYNILSYSNFKYLDALKDSYDIMEYQITEDKSILLKKNIKICQNNKLNIIGKDKTSLSKNWFNSSSPTIIKQLSKNIYNYYMNIAKDKNIYWTTFTSYQRKLEHKGIVKKFVGLNDIPKIKQNTLAYCANNYPNKTIQRKLKDTYVVNDNAFALNLLLKWIINVSDTNKIINIYLPSFRMREILTNWLNT